MQNQRTIKTSKGDVSVSSAEGGRIKVQQPSASMEYSRDEARDLSQAIEQASGGSGSKSSET